MALDEVAKMLRQLAEAMPNAIGSGSSSSDDDSEKERVDPDQPEKSSDSPDVEASDSGLSAAFEKLSKVAADLNFKSFLPRLYDDHIEVTLVPSEEVLVLHSPEEVDDFIARKSWMGESNEGEKGSFQKMVAAAKAALLSGEDPHEAAEDVLGGEPEDEAPVIKAVKKAMSQLEITDPNAEAGEA